MHARSRSMWNTGVSVLRPGKRAGLTLIELLVVLGILGVLVALMLPAVRRGGEAPRRTQCRNNLKQIGLALHNYHDVYQLFPPAYTVDQTGQPLHSWRTLILPFLEQQHLYESIDLTKPWDDPANADAYKTIVPPYICPSATIDRLHTTYTGMVGPDACLPPTQSRSLSEIKDGTSETVMVIEAAEPDAVHWMNPQDVGVRFLLSFNADSELDHEGGTHALFADGSVQFLSAEMSNTARQALATVAGSDTIDEW